MERNELNDMNAALRKEIEDWESKTWIARSRWLQSIGR